jgi:outer membrane immunogenic protein
MLATVVGLLGFIGGVGIMKKIILASVAALALTGSAFGADVSTPYYAPSILPAPVFTWTGLYLGAHGGYGWESPSIGGGLNLDMKGGFAGGQVGYNFQTGSFVFGIEGDGAWADIGETFNFVGLAVPASLSFTNDALASLRARFGVAVNNVLLYATGGGGWGHGNITGSLAGLSASADAWHSGWSGGAGIEWAFLPNWSAKFEYMHYGLGSGTYTNASIATVTTGNISVDTVKVGINFLFH